jgi:hypothetical protein
MTWKTVISNKKYLTEFTITILLLILLMLSFSQFLLFIEQREGVTLNDPILNLYTPINLTWFTFAVIYLSIILFLIIVHKNPLNLMIALQVYGLMVVFRAVAMYLVPLNPPVKMILLNDPFVQLFGQGGILTKDLFFSGHTATLFLLYLLSSDRKIRIVFLAATIAVAAAVLIQHVHYSIDVFAAPFFAYTSFRLIKQFKSKTTNNQ